MFILEVDFSGRIDYIFLFVKYFIVIVNNSFGDICFL